MTEYDAVRERLREQIFYYLPLIIPLSKLYQRRSRMPRLKEKIEWIALERMTVVSGHKTRPARIDLHARNLTEAVLEAIQEYAKEQGWGRMATRKYKITGIVSGRDIEGEERVGFVPLEKEDFE